MFTRCFGLSFRLPEPVFWQSRVVPITSYDDDMKLAECGKTFARNMVVTYRTMLMHGSSSAEVVR